VVARYPQGAEVTVHLKPGPNTWAVLEVAPSRFPWIVVGVGGLLLAFGLLFIGSALAGRGRHRRRRGSGSGRGDRGRGRLRGLDLAVPDHGIVLVASEQVALVDGGASASGQRHC
jgi:hypothetical protein